MALTGIGMTSLNISASHSGPNPSLSIALALVGENFPCDPLAPTYLNEDSGLLIALTELERRSRYMQNVNTKLHACGQFREDHPLIQLIQNVSIMVLISVQILVRYLVCWKRPELVLEMKRVRETEWNWYELFRTSPGTRSGMGYTPYITADASILPVLSSLCCIYLVQNLIQLIHDLVTENAELQQQLIRKEAETIRRQQQQQMKQKVYSLPYI